MLGLERSAGQAEVGKKRVSPYTASTHTVYFALIFRVIEHESIHSTRRMSLASIAKDLEHVAKKARMTQKARCKRIDDVICELEKARAALESLDSGGEEGSGGGCSDGRCKQDSLLASFTFLSLSPCFCTHTLSLFLCPPPPLLTHTYTHTHTHIHTHTADFAFLDLLHHPII